MKTYLLQKFGFGNNEVQVDILGFFKNKVMQIWVFLVKFILLNILVEFICLICFYYRYCYYYCYCCYRY